MQKTLDLWMKLGIEKGYCFIESPYVFGYRRLPGTTVSNFDLNVSGIRLLINQEKAGKYPGGENYKKQRSVIIGRHVRPLIFNLIEKGAFAKAWDFYKEIWRSSFF